MPIEHLTDSDIQRYLDGETSLEDDQIRDHLAICQTCRDTLEMYRQVYAGLADDRPLLLPGDFARRVVQRLAASKRTKWSPAIAGVAAGVGVVLSAAILYVLVGWQPILAFFSDLSFSRPSFLKIVVGAIRDQLAYLNGGLTFVLSGAIVLFFYGVVDRVLLKAKVRHT